MNNVLIYRHLTIDMFRLLLQSGMKMRPAPKIENNLNNFIVRLSVCIDWLLDYIDYICSLYSLTARL